MCKEVVKKRDRNKNPVRWSNSEDCELLGVFFCAGVAGSPDSIFSFPLAATTSAINSHKLDLGKDPHLLRKSNKFSVDGYFFGLENESKASG